MSGEVGMEAAKKLTDWVTDWRQTDRQSDKSFSSTYGRQNRKAAKYFKSVEGSKNAFHNFLQLVSSTFQCNFCPSVLVSYK